MKKISMDRMKPAEIRKALAHAWLRYYKFVFFAYFAAVLGGGAYAWYKSSYGTSWTQAQKEEYMNSKDTSVSFRENDFRRALEDLEERRKHYEEQLPETRNIFE